MSNPSPYELIEIEDGFAFITEEGAQYALSFRDDADYFPGENLPGPIYSFSITLVGGEIGLRDEKVRDMVYEVLRRTFEADPNTVINYTCSRDNSQEMARARLCRMWYSVHADEYERIDHYSERDRLFITALWRKGNPQSKVIQEAFRLVYVNK